jgi:hypothetical protein
MKFPDTKFDLIYIDGKHTCEYVIQDILNCQKLAHPDTILWIDDYSLFIRKAVQSLKRKGILNVVHKQNSSGKDGQRTWAEARYLFQ